MSFDGTSVPCSRNEKEDPCSWGTQICKGLTHAARATRIQSNTCCHLFIFACKRQVSSYPRPVLAWPLRSQQLPGVFLHATVPERQEALRGRGAASQKDYMEERDVSDGVPGVSRPLLESWLWVVGLLTCPFWQIQLIQSDLLRSNQYCLAGWGCGAVVCSAGFLSISQACQPQTPLGRCLCWCELGISESH